MPYSSSSSVSQKIWMAISREQKELPEICWWQKEQISRAFQIFENKLDCWILDFLLDFWPYLGNEKSYRRSAGVKTTSFLKAFSVTCVDHTTWASEGHEGRSQEAQRAYIQLEVWLDFYFLYNFVSVENKKKEIKYNYNCTKGAKLKLYHVIGLKVHQQGWECHYFMQGSTKSFNTKNTHSFVAFLLSHTQFVSLKSCLSHGYSWQKKKHDNCLAFCISSFLQWF